LHLTAEEERAHSSRLITSTTHHKRMLYHTLVLALLLSVQVASFQFGPKFVTRRSTILSETTEDSTAAADVSQVTHQLFIGNLPFDLEHDVLSSMLNDKIEAGYKYLKIAKDKKTGKSRGFGYLHFNEESEAVAALEQLKGLQVAGREVKIDLSSSQQRPERPRFEKTPQENSVFIGNLNFDVTNEAVIEMCNDLLGEGVAQRVRLLTDRESGRPRGFGHIDFNSPEEATRAIEVLNGIDLMGRTVKVDHAQRKDPNAPFVPKSPSSNPGFASREHSVFLGNLAWDVTQEMCVEMLTDVLGPEGGFTTVRLAIDRETGRPRGFGHIDFTSRDCAEKAITELNGMEVLGRQLRADFAQRKER
jgi:polyadenylate-binding protein